MLNVKGWPPEFKFLYAIKNFNSDKEDKRCG